MRHDCRDHEATNPKPTFARLTMQLAIAVFLLAASMLFAQQVIVGGPPSDKTIDARTQGIIIDSVAKALTDNYIFLDKARAMEKLVRDNYKKGAYKSVTSRREFAQRLTEDLRSVSHDLHLGVSFVSDQQLEEMLAANDSLAPNPWFEEMKENNFGFQKLEILDGNVGYLELRGFVPADIAGGTAIAAMNFLSGCDAVIFDLRKNGGGDPSMIQLISSYLFDQPVHLNSFYIRSLDTIQQFWTQAYVPGKKLPNANVYVLTSPFTFSGGEEFSYNLKNLKRGQIIGKTTGGGAHPTEDHLFASVNIQMSVPYGRAINPITGTNWENVGVTPDVDVAPEKALEIAHMMALQAISDKTSDLRTKERLQWAAEALSAEVNPLTLDESKLREYVGTYGPRKVWLENGALYYRRGENPIAKLVPLTTDRFMLEGVGYFRAQFLRGEDGSVSTFVGLYDNGTSEQHERTN